MASLPCPNCREPLQQETLDGSYGRTVVVDVCPSCQTIWFDDQEHLQLAPRGTLALFRLIDARRHEPRRALGSRLVCPACDLRLSFTTDRQRATRFHFFRCPRGHGRFITFFHFLRARNFVRNLSPREIAQLRERIRQVHCSNCGAAIDLERDVACPYCRAPVSMLDPDQTHAAVAQLLEADAQARQVGPALPLTLMAERMEVERVFAEAERGGASRDPSVAGLVEAGVSLLLEHLGTRSSR